MFRRTIWFVFLGVFGLSNTLTAAVFHTIDTTTPLLCTLSSKFQNRVMVENGKIKKIIASDEDRLSIFTDPFSGQIFISTRDYAAQETTVSVITETGIVQDLQVSFVDQSSEIVILTDPTIEEELVPFNQPSIAKDDALKLVAGFLKGKIPDGYLPSQPRCKQWRPKNGIRLDSIVQLDGPDQILYVYQLSNLAKKPMIINESDLNVPFCRWVFLESNALSSKQKILAIIAVERSDEQS